MKIFQHPLLENNNLLQNNSEVFKVDLDLWTFCSPLAINNDRSLNFPRQHTLYYTSKNPTAMHLLLNCHCIWSINFQCHCQCFVCGSETWMREGNPVRVQGVAVGPTSSSNLNLLALMMISNQLSMPTAALIRYWLVHPWILSACIWLSSQF